MKNRFFNGFGKAVTTASAVWAMVAIALMATGLVCMGCDQGIGGSSGLTLRGTVTISGPPQVGQTLMADVSGLEVPAETAPGLYQYEWQKGPDEEAEWVSINSVTDVEGNTGSYTPAVEDIGYRIRVVVSVTGYGNSITSEETDPVTAASTQVAAPTANPPAGEVHSGATVTLSTTTSGATIYYTLNGETPDNTKTQYTTAITINAAVTIKAIAVKDGMTDSEVLTAAYTVEAGEPGPTLTADVTFGTTGDDSSGTEFDLNAWTGGGESADESWTLSAVEKNQVYFTVEKEAGQTITGGGTDTAKVTVSISGAAVDGSTPGDTLAVVTVDTGDLVFDGGTREFTLTVSEADKKSRIVSITLNVEPTYKTAAGAAVFKVEREDGTETLTRLGGGAANFTGFKAALEWVEGNAEDSTEYLIRVEKDELYLPSLVVSLNKKNNVTLRLRGSKDGPRTLKPYDDAKNVLNVGGLTARQAFIQIGGDTVGNVGKRTFILGNNITVETGDIVIPGGGTRYLYQIWVGNNATLVLEKGSKLTGHDSSKLDSSNTDTPVIYIYGTNSAKQAGDATKHGKVRIEGGSITDCSVSENAPLIFCGVTKARVASETFYLAPLSGLTLNGNSNNNVFIYQDTQEWNLTQYLETGLALPFTE